MKHTLYIIVIFIMGFSVNAQPLKIKIDFPDKIQTNEKYNINLEIEKYDLTCFAEYTQIFPKGFKIEKNKKKSASAHFDFAKQKMKYSWSSLPRDTIIKISFKFSVDTFLLDSFNLQGAFTYVVNNKRGVLQTRKQIYTVSENEKQYAIKKKNKKKKKNNNNNIWEFFED